MAQAVHAAVEYALANPATAASTPNTVVLSVPSEDALVGLAEDGILFREPDLGDQATAYAEVTTGERFSSLPLAGRSLVMNLTSHAPVGERPTVGGSTPPGGTTP